MTCPRCNNQFMQHQIRPERSFCMICGHSEWIEFELKDMSQVKKK